MADETDPRDSLGDRRAQYLNRLRAKLRRHNVARFIELHLRPVQRVAPYPARLGNRRRSDGPFSVRELIQASSRSVVAVVGDPGAGKTTILADLAQRATRQNSPLPVFVPMGVYDRTIPLEDLLDLREFSPEERQTALASGSLLIIFDALNEARLDTVDDAAADVLAFIEQWPNNPCIISCRTAEFPEWLNEKVDEYSVLPVSEDQIEKQFHALLGKELGLRLFQRIFREERFTRLRELCRSPLLLAMLVSLHEPGRAGDQPLGEINSRAALYSAFLKRLDARERGKGPVRRDEASILPGFRRELLMEFGYWMETHDAVFLPEEDIQAWLVSHEVRSLITRWFSETGRPTVKVLFRNLVTRPPVVGLDSLGDGSRRFGFIHQSFGEYYAGQRMALALQRGEYDLETLTPYFLDNSRRHWETIGLLCGIVDDPTLIIGQLKRLAKRERNQTLLVLAGQSIRDAPTLPAREIDDIHIRIMDAFKYWQIPFDYELIRAMMGTAAERSPGFPRRLDEDVVRFVEKYAHVLPAELKSAPTRSLLDYLEVGDTSVVLDAAYTLGRRARDAERRAKDADAAQVVPVLLRVLERSSGDAREQIIAALKEYGSSLSLSKCLEIIDDKNESPRARAYALNTIGAIGDPAAAESVMQYLRDTGNPYRDSASWSLQSLGLAARKVGSPLIERIKATYFDALLTETSDIEGRYAKGNIVYSLSALGAREYADQIVKWVSTVVDPYVLEDGINAIGVLGGAGAEQVVIGALDSSDPMIRMKACEAVARLGDRSAVDRLHGLLDDDFPAVQEAAVDAIEDLRRRYEGTANPERDPRFPPDDQEPGKARLAVIAGSDNPGLAVRLLGTFDVSVSGREVDKSLWSQQKAAAIVKLLALTPHKRLPRERIIECLWPEADRTKVASRLSFHLHQARHILDSNWNAVSSPFLVGHDDWIHLIDGVRLQVDVDEFEQSAVSARQTGSLRDYERAIHLYTGDLLPGDSLLDDVDIEGVSGRREYVRNEFAELLISAAAIHEQQGNLEVAIGLLQRVISVNPILESAYGKLMRLYVATERSPHALQLFKDLRKALRRHLGVRPNAASLELVDEIRRGGLGRGVLQVRARRA